MSHISALGTHPAASSVKPDQIFTWRLGLLFSFQSHSCSVLKCQSTGILVFIHLSQTTLMLISHIVVFLVFPLYFPKLPFVQTVQKISQLSSWRDSWVELQLTWFLDWLFLISPQSHVFSKNVMAHEAVLWFPRQRCDCFLNWETITRHHSQHQSTPRVTVWLSPSSCTDFPTFLVSLCSLNSTFSAHWTSGASRGLWKHAEFSGLSFPQHFLLD